MASARGSVEAVLDGFLRRRGVGNSEILGVAYSGGPDSTALLAAACAVRASRIVAIHVDHGIRGNTERRAELELCIRTCRRLGCRLTVASIAPGVIQRASRDGGLEAAARRYRYRALRNVMQRRSLSHVLLAHTRDDQAETILMRLFCGAGAAGLRGISEERGPFLRPFLKLTKSDLLEYVKLRDIEYSIDSTNASSAYLRNRVRARLIPALDSTFPGWGKGLERTAQAAALDEEALSAAVAQIGFMQKSDGLMSADSSRLLAAPTAVAARAVVAAAGRLLGRNRCSWRMALAALEALRSRRFAVYVGSGLRFVRDGGEVLLGLDFPSGRGYFVRIDGPCCIRAGSLSVSASWNFESGMRAGSFSFPLVVRSRRPGDTVAFGGGTKRVDELFSEWKLSPAVRDSVAVVEDKDGIVAVLASPWGGKDRYRAGSSGDCARRVGERRIGERCFAVIVKGA